MMHKLLQDMHTLKEGLSTAGPEDVQSVIRVIQQVRRTCARSESQR